MKQVRLHRAKSKGQRLISAQTQVTSTHPRSSRLEQGHPARPKKRVTYEMTEFDTASEEKEDGAAPQKEEGGPELYERPIARYVAPPEQGKPPSIRAIYFAFQAEKDVGY